MQLQDKHASNAQKHSCLLAPDGHQCAVMLCEAIPMYTKVLQIVLRSVCIYSGVVVLQSSYICIVSLHADIATQDCAAVQMYLCN